MQQIAIEPVGLEALHRTLAGGNGAAPRGIAGQDLRHQKDFVASSCNGVRDDRLRIAIHLGGVDMGHAEIDAAAQRGDRAFAIAAVDVPGALPDHTHWRTVLAELPELHLNPPMSATRTLPVAD